MVVEVEMYGFGVCLKGNGVVFKGFVKSTKTVTTVVRSVTSCSVSSLGGLVKGGVERRVRTPVVSGF